MALMVSLLVAPLAVANHPQTAHGDAIVFDHKAGNEWWVEVRLAGGASASVEKVESMDTNGPWVPLTFRSWGAWAASFHIEPGHQVRFRSTWAGGEQALSCWFSHPGGVEDCQQAFSAQFTLVKGNEWWIQSQVTPSGGTVSAVDVALNGGAWKPLAKQSWGVREWAASYHAPDGTIVQLRATSTTGATSLSSCHRWIPPQTGGQDAPVVPCSAFRAEFVNPRGNEWWVETDVKANRAVSQVDARQDGGPWLALTKRSWGSWAASHHLKLWQPVEFRAIATDAAPDFSYRGWLWGPSVKDPYPNPESRSLAEWDAFAGDGDRVQVNSYTWYRPTGHSYRVDGGSWIPMALNMKGDWFAMGASVPNGASVEFRAEWVFENGQPGNQVSFPMPWPPWPQSGSFVEYQSHDNSNGTEPESGSFLSSSTDSRAILRFSIQGGWQGTCDMEFRRFEHRSDGTEEWRNSTASFELDHHPMVGPTWVQVGDKADVTWLSGCVPVINQETVLSRGPHATRLHDASGERLVVEAFQGGFHDERESRDIWWAADEALTLEWRFTTPPGPGTDWRSSQQGWLVDTNAPLQ